MNDLLIVIQKHPAQAKDAASALIALSEAMHLNASSAEIAVLIKGTLTQESYVRNASLQSLQVRNLSDFHPVILTHFVQALDLTDMDWCPELWVATYDNDQQNARLARHIWDDNGLDVPETFFNDLRPYLGKLLLHYNFNPLKKVVDDENASIRTSCALSLTEAASQWLQSVPHIVRSLQDYYREKAKVVGPEYDDYVSEAERV